MFRYLRYATGHETAIDGELVLDGDDQATLKVRVAGKLPTVVQGPWAQWERLVGDSAGGAGLRTARRWSSQREEMTVWTV